MERFGPAGGPTCRGATCCTARSSGVARSVGGSCSLRRLQGRDRCASAAAAPPRRRLDTTRVVRCGGRRLALESWRRAQRAFSGSGFGDGPHAADSGQRGHGRTGASGTGGLRPQSLRRRRTAGGVGAAARSPRPGAARRPASAKGQPARKGAGGACPKARQRRRGAVGDGAEARRPDGAGRNAAHGRSDARGDGERGRRSGAQPGGEETGSALWRRIGPEHQGGSPCR